MQGTSASVRPLAAGPRCELVVEVYVPEPITPRPPAREARIAHAAPISRWLCAVIVIAMHASIGAWLMRAPRTPPPPPVQPLQLLELPAPLARQALVLDLPQAEITQVPINLPALPTTPRAPAEMALPVTASTDLVIEEANTASIDELVSVCRANGLAAAPRPKPAGPLTLLVRVEKDGRVTDSKIEAGSGLPHWDDAALRCLLARGSLLPRRVNGAAVASWQRVHWPASSS